ncbi:MAG: DNA repair ATPase [Cardiobacteriaceae bacterium]|nr:DNA repair ATPase [Cardiobacteriaceae bacterium]
MTDLHSETLVNQAVAEGSAYAIIRKRLEEQGARLQTLTRALNEARTAHFGSTEMRVVARIRVRTEHNCIARDMVQLGDTLLFGYNVFMGLKPETHVADVFALFALEVADGQTTIREVPLAGSFLQDSRFTSDFDELYRYYKHTRLTELTVRDGKLLAAFQIGERAEDRRVFRWQLRPDGTPDYIDNRGERDIALPEPYDFLWHSAGRERLSEDGSHLNIADTLFVATRDGTLTLRMEDNTQGGQTLLAETLADRTQSLADLDAAWADVDGLLLLRLTPYREAPRHYIFNRLTQALTREDSLGDSCVQLPEGHGILYPGGYALASGEIKNYDEPQGMTFKRKIRAPNGEDMLFVFYAPARGEFALYSYNLISKSLQNPVYGHGYALSPSGALTIFSAEGEPTRVHPMQIWQTPYCSDEHAANQPQDDAPFSRIGNPDLVRGISDLYSVARLIGEQQASQAVYERLQKQIQKLFDDYYWLDDASLAAEATLAPFAALLRDMDATADNVIDEFEKAEAIRRDAAHALEQAREAQRQLQRDLQHGQWATVGEHAQALARIGEARGQLVMLGERRGMDTAALGELQQALDALQAQTGERTVAFLRDANAFAAYHDALAQLAAQIDAAAKRSDLDAILADIQHSAAGLDELSALMNTLEIEDATLRTRIIDDISAVYARLNQERARARHKGQGLGSEEAAAQFAAQMKLLTQSLGNALADVQTPEDCDDALARLLVQLENLESRFADDERFLADLADKRDDLHSALTERKQQLLEARERKGQQLADAGSRILDNLARRAQTFSDVAAFNTWLASDALVQKIAQLGKTLREQGDTVRADDLDARFKAIRDQAIRTLRDKSELFDGEHLIRFGQYRFSVNSTALDLVLLPREGKLCAHLAGTQYFQPIEHPELDALRDYWDISVLSESAALYRSEYLAAEMLRAAVRREQGLTLEALGQAVQSLPDLQALAAAFAAPRYQEGYEKGIHDHDAARILQAVFPLWQHAGSLRYPPNARALAQLYWAEHAADHPALAVEAQAAAQMAARFAHSAASDALVAELAPALRAFAEGARLDSAAADVAAAYLVAECAAAQPAFVVSRAARAALERLQQALGDADWRAGQANLATLERLARYRLARHWLASVHEADSAFLDEAAAVLALEGELVHQDSAADLDYRVEGLLGSHPRLDGQALAGSVDDFLARSRHHREVVIPAVARYHALRQQVAAAERQALDLDNLVARPLTSFVRNRLIHEHYLPLIGANLAKQMGAAGEGKRSDLMGLLLMISPPGYGKTTLMEYVANRLGLVFIKINGPSLGHAVTGIDPAQAPDAAARAELERLNLALEMGDNVMLYIDDIQHTHPAFLQKFIPLCDATRRMDGVWRGEAKTYDLRGRKFAVVMAGNPYTESGEAFNVPDMLANRADIYNLGDIIGDSGEAFAQSYLENALTSNPVLAPLALRDPEDIRRFIRLAQGETVAASDFVHPYSGAESGEIAAVLARMMRVRDVVLAVNRAYIASAAQEDRYRSEPPFRLQGSYRNMNKMSEKISAVMNDAELEQLIIDHYQGEAQLLKDGGEANLLKFGELRGTLSDEEKTRWDDIKTAFRRLQALGGSDSAQEKIVIQLKGLHDTLQQTFAQMDQTLATLAPAQSAAQQQTLDAIRRLTASIAAIAPKELHMQQENLAAIRQLAEGVQAIKPTVNIAAPQEDAWLARFSEMVSRLEAGLQPVLEQLGRNLDMNYVSIYKINRLAKQVDKLAEQEAKGNISQKPKK